MTEFNAKEQEAFEAMRTAFDGEDGFGMPMNDLTYGRYLRARLTSRAKLNLATNIFNVSFRSFTETLTW